MYTKVEQIFQSGQWKEEFPGKEMFKEISSYLNPDNSGLDFIKSVGERQRENAKDNKKPLPLAELRKSIEDRVKSTYLSPLGIQLSALGPYDDPLFRVR